MKLETFFYAIVVTFVMFYSLYLLEQSVGLVFRRVSAEIERAMVMP